MVDVEVKQDSSVGQKLSLARNARASSDMEQISHELCIRPHLLAALEQDDFNKFPSACYAAGSLKNYAAYLGLDVPQIIGQYKREFQGSSEKVDLVFITTETNSNHLQKMLVSAAILCVIVLSTVGYNMRGDDNLSLSSLPNVSDVTSEILVSVVGADSVAQNETMEPVIVVAEKSQGYHLVPQANAASGAAIITAQQTDQLRLKVRQDSWVRIIDANREILIDRLLLAGEEFMMTDRRGMTLMTSNAGAVSVYRDDIAARHFGVSGEIRDNISLNKQDLLLKTAQLSP